MNKMGVWTHTLIENFCLYRGLSKKIDKSCSMDEMKKSFDNKNYKIKWNTKKNEHYISPNKRPSWCKKHNKDFIPRFNCLCDEKNGKCPFFAYTNADEKDYRLFNKAYNNAYKRKRK